MKNLIFPALAATLMCSCTINAHLTPTSGPLARQGITSLPASFTWVGSASGKVSVTMPDGEVCVGRYFTVVEGYRSRTYGHSSGAFYGQGNSEISGTYGGSSIYGQSRNSVSGYANANHMGSTHTYRNEQFGKAIATGSKGTVITLDYETSGNSPTHGHGMGKDNKGNLYSIIF